MNTASHSRGFTLIELMIVVAIVAVLTAIAYPAYQEHVLRTRRTTASGCMLEMAQFMERYHTTRMSYAGAAIAPDNYQCADDLAAFYDFNLASVDASSFSITASPKGGQSNDTKCGVLSVNQAGQKAHSGTAASSSDCW